MSKFICTLHVYYKVLLFKFNLVMRRIFFRGNLYVTRLWLLHMYYLSNISSADLLNWIFTASTKVCTIRNFTTIALQSKNYWKAFQNWYQLSSAQCAHSVRISGARAQREARAHLIINQPVRSRWKWPHGSRSPFSFFFPRGFRKILALLFFM